MSERIRWTWHIVELMSNQISWSDLANSTKFCMFATAWHLTHHSCRVILTVSAGSIRGSLDSWVIRTETGTIQDDHFSTRWNSSWLEVIPLLPTTSTNINLVLQGSINFKIPLGQLPIKNREFRRISFYRSQTNRSMQHCYHKILAKFPCSRPATAAQCSLWGRLHLFFSKN